jgi:hypothetical protein
VRFWCYHERLFQQFTPKLKSLFDEEFHGCSQPYGKLLSSRLEIQVSLTGGG